MLKLTIHLTFFMTKDRELKMDN